VGGTVAKAYYSFDTSCTDGRRQNAAGGGQNACAPRKQTKLDDFAYKFPPTPRVGLVWPRPHRPALILLFAKKFFRVVAVVAAFVSNAGRLTQPPLHTNEVDRTNILAPGFWSGTCRTHLLPAFTPENSRDWPIGKSYPVTAAQLLPIRTRFLAPIHFFQARKELDPEVAACAWRFKIYLINAQQISCAFD
jgi:hypothetical protein